MKLNEAKISDIAIEAGEQLGLYDKENQTLSRKDIVKHLMDMHGLKQKRDIAFVIDSMKISFPKMKIKENKIKKSKLVESANTVRLSKIIVMVKDAMKKKPRVKNYNQLKDLLPQLEDYLSDHGDKELPRKELERVMNMAENKINEVEKISIVSKHVKPFANWMDKELWYKKGNMMFQDTVDEKTGKVTTLKKTLQQLYDMFKKENNMKEGQVVQGGKGDHLSPKDVDKNELAVGIEVEYEHAEGDRIAAIDISLDHLKEDPKYYSKLVASGIVDEPKAIKLAKELLGVEPKKVNESVKLSKIIREEIRSILKEEPELWDYIYNFGNTYTPKKQG